MQLVPWFCVISYDITTLLYLYNNVPVFILIILTIFNEQMRTKQLTQQSLEYYIIYKIR